MKLLEYTNKGLYCSQADVYIDPHKRVNYALITHGHADHARAGHKHYLCVDTSAPILSHRLGAEISIQSIPYEKPIVINGVTFSFHPAGHIVGSAMIRAEYKGEVWVVSGDYKIEDDGLAEAYSPVACHHFITECTFGKPSFVWPKQEKTLAEINTWWAQNASERRPSLITAYSLGKAQRLINSVNHEIGPILTYGPIHRMNGVFRKMGIRLPASRHLNSTVHKNLIQQALILAPPNVLGTPWCRRVKGYSLGVASGWMAIDSYREKKDADKGFVLSDHCDWPGLLTAVKDSGAEHIYTTHGDSKSFAQELRKLGYDAMPIDER